MMIPLKDLVEKHNIVINGVLHLGGSTGQERFDYDNYTKGKVIWVEAIPSVYEQLKQNILPFKNHSCLCACLSNVNGEVVEFNISNNESQSSSILQLGVHSIIHPEVHYIDKIKLRTERLDSLLTKEDLEDVNFLNVDLQGAEHLAIEGMGNLIKGFDWCLAEVNKLETYKGCMTIDDFDYFMLQRGFDRVETGQWVADCWTDALYKRII